MEKRGGISAVLNKLNSAIERGDYYHAQQLYKTLYFRYTARRKYNLVRTLLLQGSTLMFKHNQFHAGAELAMLLLDHYKETKAPIDEDSMSRIVSLFLCFPSTVEKQRRLFVNTAISWSSSEENNNQGHRFLHSAFAEQYDKEDEYGLAESHFLRCSLPEKHASMLIRWAKTVLEGERDLLVARTVLQYLCLLNLKNAELVFMLYRKDTGIDTPLIHFIDFLLQSCKAASPTVFQTLTKKYSPSLDRDDMFSKYLDMIGAKYFKMPLPQEGGMAGLMKGLFKSMMK